MGSWRVSGVGELARLCPRVRGGMCGRFCAHCECRCAWVGVGRQEHLGGRHRQARSPNQKLITQLPTLGPGDVAAAFQSPSVQATMISGSHLPLGKWGNISGRNDSNDESCLPSGYSLPRVLSTDLPALKSHHNPGSRDNMPISQVEKRGPRQVQGHASQPVSGQAGPQAQIFIWR